MTLADDVNIEEFVMAKVGSCWSFLLLFFPAAMSAAALLCAHVRCCVVLTEVAMAG